MRTHRNGTQSNRHACMESEGLPLLASKAGSEGVQLQCNAAVTPKAGNMVSSHYSGLCVCDKGLQQATSCASKQHDIKTPRPLGTYLLATTLLHHTAHTQAGPGVKSLHAGDLVLPLRPFSGTWATSAVWPERALLRLPADGYGLPLEYLAMAREMAAGYRWWLGG